MADPDLMDKIVKLQRQVSTLIEIVEKLYIVAHDSQKFRPEAEAAFNGIGSLLEHAKNPDA